MTLRTRGAKPSVTQEPTWPEPVGAVRTQAVSGPTGDTLPTAHRLPPWEQTFKKRAVWAEGSGKAAELL